MSDNFQNSKEKSKKKEKFTPLNHKNMTAGKKLHARVNG